MFRTFYTEGRRKSKSVRVAARARARPAWCATAAGPGAATTTAAIATTVAADGTHREFAIFDVAAFLSVNVHAADYEYVCSPQDKRILSPVSLSLSSPIARTTILTIILFLRLARNCDVHVTAAHLRRRITACRMPAATESSRRTATPFSIRLH